MFSWCFPISEASSIFRYNDEPKREPEIRREHGSHREMMPLTAKNLYEKEKQGNRLSQK